MKILHVSYITDFSGGVFKKLRASAESAYKNNYNIDFMYLNNEFDFTEENRIYKKICRKKNLKYIISINFFKYLKFCAYIPFEEYDFIILRYVMGPDFGSTDIFRKYAHKLITEHHTNENREIFNYHSGIKKFINIFFELYYGKKIIQNSNYCISVSDSVSKFQKKKSSSIKTYVVGNGFDVASIKKTGFREFDGCKLSMIMMATRFSKWHGLDRLLNSLRHYSGSVQIILNIVGNISHDYRKLTSVINKSKAGKVNIKLHGFLYGEKLENLFREQNIAVSSLGMYRLGIDYACSLKVSEYLARGIPIINGNRDTNIKECFNYNLFVGNNRNIIDFEKVFNFCLKLKDSLNISEEIRRYALENVDYTVKHQELYEVLKGIKNRGQNEK